MKCWMCVWMVLVVCVAAVAGVPHAGAQEGSFDGAALGEDGAKPPVQLVDAGFTTGSPLYSVFHATPEDAAAPTPTHTPFPTRPTVNTTANTMNTTAAPAAASVNTSAAATTSTNTSTNTSTSTASMPRVSVTANFDTPVRKLTATQLAEKNELDSLLSAMTIDFRARVPDLHNAMKSSLDPLLAQINSFNGTIKNATDRHTEAKTALLACPSKMAQQVATRTDAEQLLAVARREKANLTADADSTLGNLQQRLGQARTDSEVLEQLLTWLSTVATEWSSDPGSTHMLSLISGLSGAADDHVPGADSASEAMALLSTDIRSGGVGGTSHADMVTRVESVVNQHRTLIGQLHTTYAETVAAYAKSNNALDARIAQHEGKIKDADAATMQLDVECQSFKRLDAVLSEEVTAAQAQLAVLVTQVKEVRRRFGDEQTFLSTILATEAALQGQVLAMVHGNQTNATSPPTQAALPEDHHLKREINKTDEIDYEKKMVNDSAPALPTVDPNADKETRKQKKALKAAKKDAKAAKKDAKAAKKDAKAAKKDAKAAKAQRRAARAARRAGQWEEKPVDRDDDSGSDSDDGSGSDSDGLEE